MAYIPWWQRMSPPTFAERFNLGGLAGRVGFKHGGTWADWKVNYEDQMSFEEYLQDDVIVKKIQAIDKKAKGGRMLNPVQMGENRGDRTGFREPRGPKPIESFSLEIQERIKEHGIEKYNKLSNEQKYEVRTKRTSTKPYNFRFGKNKFDATVTGLTKKGANNVQNLLNLINEKDLTPNKWFARTSKAGGIKGGLDLLARDVVKYLKGETVTHINQKIFDTIDIKTLIGDKADIVSKIDGISFRQAAGTAGSAKAQVEASFDAVKLLNKEFMLDPDATIEELAERLYGKGASNSVRALQDTQADIAKYLDVLKTGTRQGIKIPNFKYPSAKQVFEILDSIEDRSSTFGFQDGVIRELKFNIRDNLLNFKKGSTLSLRRMLSEVIAGSDFAGSVIDEAVGLSASYDKLPGYTEATQILPKELNQLKASEIDKPFNEIINKVYDGTATSKEIKAYNKVARNFMKKYKIDVPIIKSTVTGDDIKNPKKYIRNFDSFSTEAQKNILEIAKNKNFVIQTGAKPLALQEGKATMEMAKKFLKRIGKTAVKQLPIIGTTWGVVDAAETKKRGLTELDELVVGYHAGPAIAQWWADYKAKQKDKPKTWASTPLLNPFKPSDEPDEKALGGLSGVDQYILNRYK